MRIWKSSNQTLVELHHNDVTTDDVRTVAEMVRRGQEISGPSAITVAEILEEAAATFESLASKFKRHARDQAHYHHQRSDQLREHGE